MQRVTFGQFLGRTAVYERLPVEVDPGLRRAAWLSWLACGLYWAFYRLLPDGGAIERAVFFQATWPWMRAAWDLVAACRPALLAAWALLAVALLALCLLTRGFRRAGLWAQLALAVPVAAAAAGLPAALALLLPVLVNLLLWLCAGLAVLAAGAALLGSLFWALSH